MAGECVISSLLSRHSKDLKWQTSVTARLQLSFFWQAKESILPMREGGLTPKARPRSVLASSFYTFVSSPPLEPALCKFDWPRRACVCFTWSSPFFPYGFSFVLMFFFFCAGYSLFCLLATVILDSVFLFQLPNIPLSRDGRPNYFGIGALRSLWLLPAELGWWEALGLPLLLVSGLRVLMVLSI